MAGVTDQELRLAQLRRMAGIADDADERAAVAAQEALDPLEQQRIRAAQQYQERMTKLQAGGYDYDGQELIQRFLRKRGRMGRR